jgi:AraC-like DNA-binding protein
MKDNFKYLTVGEEDRNWGLFLNVAGSSDVKPGSNYPCTNHPSGYHFNWDEGRVLHEFQINYITQGAGIYENKFGKFAIKPGSIFLTFPGIWHRYKPLKNFGWIENYVGFDGAIAEELMSHSQFKPNQPVINVGIKEELFDTYYKIYDLVEKEQPGFQQIASGMVVKLLGYIISFEKQKEFSGKWIAKVIEEIRFRMRQNIDNEINLEELAKQNNVGYSYFRKMFKKFTGVSPRQYYLQLRMMRAKELLISTDKSIKEISYELGFQSIYYFSNLFKKKEGISPSMFRNKNTIQNK